jgi:hypothetical protein
MSEKQSTKSKPQRNLGALSTGEENALAWMGPPPLLRHEDASKYLRVRSKVAAALQPTDILAWFLVDDVVYHQFDIVRLRQVSTTLVEAAKNDPTRTMSYRGEDSDAAKTAWAVRNELNNLERIDRMIATKELRRDRAALEADRRRHVAAAAQASCHANHIEDLDYRVLENNSDTAPPNESRRLD